MKKRLVVLFLLSIIASVTLADGYVDHGNPFIGKWNAQFYLLKQEPIGDAPGFFYMSGDETAKLWQLFVDGTGLIVFPRSIQQPINYEWTEDLLSRNGREGTFTLHLKDHVEKYTWHRDIVVRYNGKNTRSYVLIILHEMVDPPKRIIYLENQLASEDAWPINPDAPEPLP